MSNQRKWFRVTAKYEDQHATTVDLGPYWVRSRSDAIRAAFKENPHFEKITFALSASECLPPGAYATIEPAQVKMEGPDGEPIDPDWVLDALTVLHGKIEAKFFPPIERFFNR